MLLGTLIPYGPTVRSWRTMKSQKNGTPVQAGDRFSESR